MLPQLPPNASQPSPEGTSTQHTYHHHHNTVIPVAHSEQPQQGSNQWSPQHTFSPWAAFLAQSNAPPPSLVQTISSEQITPHAQPHERHTPTTSQPTKNHPITNLRLLTFVESAIKSHSDLLHLPKAQATLRWLLLVSANAQDEQSYNQALKLCPVVNLPDIAIPSFKDPPLAHLPAVDPPVPQFIRSFNTASAAVLTRLTKHGETKFYSNPEFADWFFTEKYANEVYRFGSIAGEIMSEVFASPQDLTKYMECLCDLMLKNPEFEAEGKLVSRCKFRDSTTKLCVVQIRCHSDKAGDLNACVWRIVPLPISDYLLDERVLEALSSASTAPVIPTAATMEKKSQDAQNPPNKFRSEIAEELPTTFDAQSTELTPDFDFKKMSGCLTVDTNLKLRPPGSIPSSPYCMVTTKRPRVIDDQCESPDELELPPTTADDGFAPDMFDFLPDEDLRKLLDDADDTFMMKLPPGLENFDLESVLP